MAAPSEIDRSRDYLRTLIDYGSGRLKICVQPVRPGSSQEWEILDVKFDGNNSELEQVLIKDDAEGLIVGKNATDSWHRRNRCPDASIFLWKLCLSPEYRDSPFAKQAYNAIGATQDEPAAIEELIEEHLRYIRDKIHAFLQQEPYALHCGNRHEPGCKCHMETLQFETTITIPVAWNNEARGIMTDAARNAGFSNIRLKYEPVCAAAADLPRLRNNHDITDEDLICCADGGHGTMDVVTVHTIPSTSHPDGFDINVVGDPTGDLAGGSMVEEAAYRYMNTRCPEVEKHGGLSSLCALLGISTDDFQRQTYKHVTRTKEESSLQDTALLINGIARASDDPGMTEIYIRISRDNMISFIMEWVEAAYKTISDHLKKPGNYRIGTRECCAVHLFGGISKCETAIDEIRTRLEADFGIKHLWTPRCANPVARGGLRRYPRNEADKLPEGSLFLIRDEPWDHQKHTQGTIWVKRWEDEEDGKLYAGNDMNTGQFPKKALELAGWKDKRIADAPKRAAARPGAKTKTLKPIGGHALPDPDWVERCRYTRTIWATNRLVSVMNRSSTSVTVNPVAWTAHVDPKLPARLRFKMFYSRAGQVIALHSPLYAAKEKKNVKEGNDAEERKLRRGLVAWPTKYISLPDLAQHGFKETTISGGEPFYKCNCIIHTEAAPGSLTLRVKVLAADERYRFDYDRETKTENLNLNHNYRLAFAPLVKEIWGTYSTHVIDDTTFHDEVPSKNPKKRPRAADFTDGHSTAEVKRSSRLMITGGGPSFGRMDITNTNHEEDLYNSTPPPRGSLSSFGVDTEEDLAASERIMRVVDRN